MQPKRATATLRTMINLNAAAETAAATAAETAAATAGAAADRFVVDYGTSTSSYSGTSYSAPRVAGYAAIIKQKYPNATGAQITSAILNTAVLKSGWSSAIYGKGQVDLTAALKYLGS